MANSITKATQYINNQQEVLRMFNTNLLCADLLKPLAEHKGNVVSYDQLSFSSYTMGDYDRDSGLTQKDFTFARQTKTLSQDKGDSLSLDVMDRDEAQIANGIVGVYNFYNVKVVVPTIDAYAFDAISGTSTTGTVTVHSSVSTSTIIGDILADFKTLKNKRIKTNECILYIGATCYALLEEATIGKGILTLGAWNGNLDAQVLTFKGAKVIEVPDDLLPSDVQWFIVHPLAVDVIPVLNGAEFKSNIPNYVGRAQVDVRYYYDAWILPNGGGDGVVVSVSASRS